MRRRPVLHEAGHQSLGTLGEAVEDLTLFEKRLQAPLNVGLFLCTHIQGKPEGVVETQMVRLFGDFSHVLDTVVAKKAKPNRSEALGEEGEGKDDSVIPKPRPRALVCRSNPGFPREISGSFAHMELALDGGVLIQVVVG